MVDDAVKFESAFQNRTDARCMSSAWFDCRFDDAVVAESSPQTDRREVFSERMTGNIRPANCNKY